ncbi:hypothetical protein [Mesorhizobium sp. M0586]|uniref:hypothetical protein n=1 Tax=unclassified Mesorhizobium TaxID=325217 RepID=UPI0033362978
MDHSNIKTIFLIFRQPIGGNLAIKTLSPPQKIGRSKINTYFSKTYTDRGLAFENIENIRTWDLVNKILQANAVGSQSVPNPRQVSPQLPDEILRDEAGVIATDRPGRLSLSPAARA